MGHGGRADGADEQAPFFQRPAQGQGFGRIADHQGLYGRCGGHEGEAELRRAPAKLLDQSGQAFPAPVFLAQDFQALEGGRGQGAGHGRGEDVVARTLNQGLDQGFLSGHKGAGGAECLAQGAHQHLHILGGIAGRIDQPHAIRAMRAHAVGIVDHDPGPVPLCQGDELLQAALIAIHAERAVADDQLAGGGCLALGKLALQVGAVPMREPDAFRPADPAAIQQRGVIQAILENMVANAHQGVDRAQIGGVAAAV